MIQEQSPNNSVNSPRINWAAGKSSGKIILDAGFAADKQFAPALFQAIVKKNPESLVVGLDINFKKITAMSLANTLGGDIFNLPIKSSSIDCFIAGEIFEHLPSIWSAVSEISRVVKPKGIAIITTPSPYGFFRYLKNWLFADKLSIKNTNDYLGNYDHKIFWDPLSLIKLFHSNGFIPQEITTTNLALPYLPDNWRSPEWHFWPVNRLGTYSCLLFKKL